MTGAAIQLAAAWLRAQTPRPSPVIPALRSKFGLTPLEAIQAIRAAGESQDMETRASSQNDQA
ncbi:hypothetical protein ACP4J4_20265 (plasmid) [Aureimonas ureilytica]|uniref:hypothetical protein n=1 Tax=Aureimonas ureilytica TaxID=401562 RepID=UPI003CFAD076